MSSLPTPPLTTLPSIFSSHTLQSTSSSSLSAITIPSTSPTPINLTYASLGNAVNLLTRSLHSLPPTHRPSPGDVVSTSLTNSLEFVLTFFGTTNDSLRCVSAPLNPAYSKDEVSFYLKDTGASILLVGRQTKLTDPTVVAGRECGVPVYAVHLKLGNNQVEGVELKKLGDGGQRVKVQVSNQDQSHGGNVKMEDVALVLHTSGTTGKPKGVPLTHLNLLTTMSNISKWYEFTTKDRGLMVMPLFHVHGLLCGLLAPLLAKSSVVIPPKFSAGTFWKDFVGDKCNWYTAVPTIHSILLSSPKPSPIPHIRFIRSCSSSLSPTVFHALESTFHAPVLEAYAMSEAAHMMTGSPLPQNGPRYPGSVGRPAGVQLTIRDASNGKEVMGKGDKKECRGEVCIRGKNVMLGYLNNEKANKEGYWKGEKEGKEWRWFRTGDEGYLTEEGYLVLTGRLKELINRGGEKISPIELDSALLSLKGVAEAVSFGVEDAKYGEKVWAMVVLKTGEKEDQARLKQELEGKVAKFKIPERIIFTDAIPKTATGKIQRRNVRDKFLAKEAAEAKGKRQAKL